MRAHTSTDTKILERQEGLRGGGGRGEEGAAAMAAVPTELAEGRRGEGRREGTSQARHSFAARPIEPSLAELLLRGSPKRGAEPESIAVRASAAVSGAAARLLRSLILVKFYVGACARAGLYASRPTTFVISAADRQARASCN